MEAQRIAAVKLLRLVNVASYPSLQASVDRSSVHPVYKLMSGNDLHQLQMQDHAERKQSKKTVQKVLQLTSTATDHDIHTKICAAEDWLARGDDVKVLILGRTDMKNRMVRCGLVIRSPYLVD